MRILHIGKYYPPFSGGIENFMAALLPELAGRGLAQAAVVHQHRRGLPACVEERDGVRLYRCPIQGKLLFVPLSAGFSSALRRAVAEFRPDLLHLHVPNVSAFWALSSTFRDLPVVMHWHSDVAASGVHAGLSAAYPFYRPVERRLLARAAAVVSTSPPYLESSAALGAWREKCRVIPLALALPSAPALGAPLPLSPWRPATRLRILSVGRLTYYKGHEVLIRAAASLEGAEIVIVGSGERRKALEDLILRLGVGDRVRLFGAASEDELGGLLESCHCLCLPSIERTEAFGLVLLEAMRAGRPCVLTDVPGSGMSWVVEDGRTGLVARRGDADSLRAALARLRDDAALRESLGAAGRRRFEERFTIAAVAEQVADLYREVLAGR